VRLAKAAEALGDTQLAIQAYLGGLDLVVKSNDINLQEEMLYELLLVLSKTANGKLLYIRTNMLSILSNWQSLLANINMIPLPVLIYG
jgi:hypothetical protein